MGTNLHEWFGESNFYPEKCFGGVVEWWKDWWTANEHECTRMKWGNGRPEDRPTESLFLWLYCRLKPILQPFESSLFWAEFFPKWYYSRGVPISIIPFLHHSNTPVLQYSLPPTLHRWRFVSIRVHSWFSTGSRRGRGRQPHRPPTCWPQWLVYCWEWWLPSQRHVPWKPMGRTVYHPYLVLWSQFVTSKIHGFSQSPFLLMRWAA